MKNCPLCGAAESQSTGPLAPPITAHAGAEMFAQPAYLVRACAQCGLLFRDPTLSPDEFASYYAQVPASKWEIAGYYPTERALLERLETLPAQSKVLDFGCSSGRLLTGLVRQYRCYGIEINPEAARAAAQRGLHMLSLGELTGADAPRFDAIVLVDVFEHLAEPLELLRALVGALAPGGSLMIVTGNGDAAACRRDPAQFWYFRIIEHVAMLTHASAEFFAAKLNLELLEWTSLCHYDLTWRERLVQETQNFLYWQFRRRTLLARSILRFLPFFSRLRRAEVAPTYNCSPDHVLAVFKTTR